MKHTHAITIFFLLVCAYIGWVAQAGSMMKPGKKAPDVKALYNHAGDDANVLQILDILADAPNFFATLETRASNPAETQADLELNEKTYSVEICLAMEVKIKEMMGKPVNRMAETAICRERVAKNNEAISKMKRLINPKGGATDIRIAEKTDMPFLGGGIGSVSGHSANVMIFYKQEDPVAATELYTKILEGVEETFKHDAEWQILNMAAAQQSGLATYERTNKEIIELYEGAGMSAKSLDEVAKLQERMQARVEKISEYVKELQPPQVTISNHWISDLKYQAGLAKGQPKSNSITLMLGFKGGAVEVMIMALMYE